MTLPKHPMQPVMIDEHGVARFRGNALVRYLLDHGGLDLNKLAMVQFDADERQHFAQLIGYSVSGYGELSYVDDANIAAADAQTDVIMGRASAGSAEALIGPDAVVSHLAESGWLPPGTESVVRDVVAAYGHGQRTIVKDRILRSIKHALDDIDSE